MAAFIGVLKGIWGWKWQIALLLVGLLAWGRGKEITGLHGQLAEDKVALAKVKSEGEEQQRHDAAINAAAKAETQNVQNQLASALEAHRLTSAALSERVRDYEACALASRSRVPPGPDPAGPKPGDTGGGPLPSSSERIGLAFAALTANCQTVVDEFRACSKWAQTVKCH